MLLCLAVIYQILHMLTIKKKYILVLVKDFVQGINGTTIYAEGLHKVNFTENNKKFCLSLHCNGANSYLLMVQKFLSLKQKILKL